jgi:hypothetical protein
MTRIEEIEGRLSAAIELTGEPVSRLSIDPADLHYLLDFAKAAREALEFYADRQSYRVETDIINENYPVMDDGGKTAREALALLERPQ